ncbi:MAG TPA: DUF6502 family protein [Burkholderiaceae bacterium]|nr:DUF6502 family protein [Burkholderiaceae bacterium]
MEIGPRATSALHAAVMRLLRPLVRLLLRHAVPHAAFQELAKRVYVEVAMNDFAIPGKKPSAARASILTGLTRKDVQRLLAAPEPDGVDAADRYNRAARVLSGWLRDATFHDTAGKPRPLSTDDPQDFPLLARLHSGDMPARAVLDELLRVGAVQRRDDGLIEPLTRAYVPLRSSTDKLQILGTDVADLIETIDHNLQEGGPDPRFQRKVMYHRIRVEDLPSFRARSAAQGQALLERLDTWLAAHDVDAPGERDDLPHARVGVGIYYFEERLDAPTPPPERGKP